MFTGENSDERDRRWAGVIFAAVGTFSLAVNLLDSRPEVIPTVGSAVVLMLGIAVASVSNARARHWQYRRRRRRGLDNYVHKIEPSKMWLVDLRDFVVYAFEQDPTTSYGLRYNRWMDEVWFVIVRAVIRITACEQLNARLAREFWGMFESLNQLYAAGELYRRLVGVRAELYRNFPPPEDISCRFPQHEDVGLRWHNA